MTFISIMRIYGFRFKRIFLIFKMIQTKKARPQSLAFSLERSQNQMKF